MFFVFPDILDFADCLFQGFFEHIKVVVFGIS